MAGCLLFLSRRRTRKCSFKQKEGKKKNVSDIFGIKRDLGACQVTTGVENEAAPSFAFSACLLSTWKIVRQQHVRPIFKFFSHQSLSPALIRSFESLEPEPRRHRNSILSRGYSCIRTFDSVVVIVIIVITMDAVVQLIRNALCCVKDLGLFQDALPFLWDPAVTAKYIGILPDPLNKTTPLEVIISVTQAYVFTTATRSGWSMFTSSFGKLRRIDRLLMTRKAAKSDADRLMNSSLVKEGKYAFRSTFIGFLVTLIGMSFFWLAANSWHVTETDWIGGLPALIHALTVAEIALLVLLYYMWKDAGEQLAKAKRMEGLAAALEKGNLTPKEVGLPSFEALTGWVPFWDAGVDPALAAPDPKEEEKLIEKEFAIVTSKIKEILGDPANNDGKAKDDSKEKARKQLQQEKAEELIVRSKVTRWEGYREYLYFVINAIAFYGYLLSVIVFYFDDEDNKPHTVRYVLMHMGNEVADWHGNFVGDLMWTIEPVIILSSPVLFSYMKPKAKKIKSD